MIIFPKRHRGEPKGWIKTFRDSHVLELGYSLSINMSDYKVVYRERTLTRWRKETKGKVLLFVFGRWRRERDTEE